jgi:hypothetical protein
VKPTSRKRKVSAVKEEATRLHSRLVRHLKGPWCQCGCGKPATDAAHIVGRVYSHTRTDLDNALALNAECHRRFTNWPDEWVEFLNDLIGPAEYQRLKAKAQSGVNVKVDWFDELDRLRAIAEQIGLAA